MNRPVTYIFLGVMVACFAFVLYLITSALITQERDFREQYREHKRLASLTIKEREQAFEQARQRVETLTRDKERVQKQLEEARARLKELEESEQDFAAGLSRDGRQPDSEEVGKFAKLPVEQIVAKLREALDAGDRAASAVLAAALRQNREEAFNHLMEMVANNADNSQRLSNIRMLAVLKDPRSLTFFQDILKSEKEPMTRRAAAGALYGIPDRSSVPLLIEVLREDKDWGVKTNAAAALGVIRDPRAVEPLKEIFRKEENATLRNFALAAIAKIADPGSLDFLTEITEKSDNTDHRLIAVTGLRAIATPEAAAVLKKISTGQKGTIAQEAKKAFEELSSETAPEDKEVTEE